MSAFSALLSRVKKCQKICSIMNRIPKRSFVDIDLDGNLLWEEGVEYTQIVLAVPLPMTMDEWEENNIRDSSLRYKL